ncbi:DUF2683 family protein [Candidatus Woesearchaeota archaeon]|nr:DUF2683 family protein [Candidatus Woesearchaeota archaeon]
MVQAMIKIGEQTNRVLNIVKAKYGLKDKSRAIELVVSGYESEFLEPELRPEYVEKIKKIKKGKFHRYDSVDALRKQIENA